MAGGKTAGIAAAAVVLVPVAAVMAITLLVTGIATWGGEATVQIEQASCTVTQDGAEYPLDSIPNGWGPLVAEAAKTAGLPAGVAAAQLKQESGWAEDAVSPAGAQGVAQFMPGTWAVYGENGDPFSARDAIPAYGRYMAALKIAVQPLAGLDAELLIRLMLAAYNAGPAAVQQYGGVPPYSETETYITGILAGDFELALECGQHGSGGQWGGDLGEGEWTNPLPGGVMVSGFGARNVPGLPAWAQDHMGIDFATGTGTGDGGPVVAPTDLRITGFNDQDGCVIAKEDGDDPDFGFAFCHLNFYPVYLGDKLKRGDIIGTEGNKAALGAIATHLHFEIYQPQAPELAYPYEGWNLDPEPILREKGAWPQ